MTKKDVRRQLEQLNEIKSLWLDDTQPAIIRALDGTIVVRMFKLFQVNFDQRGKLNV